MERVGLYWGQARNLLHKVSVTRIRGRLRLYPQCERTLRWMAPQIHHSAPDRVGTKVLQSTRTARLPHIRQLVEWLSRVCGRYSVSEQHQRPDLRCPGRNLVVSNPDDLRQA